MKPIPDWKQSWRLLSVQVAGLAVVFGLLPMDQQTAILEWIGIAPERIPAVIGGLFVLARITKQPSRE